MAGRWLIVAPHPDDELIACTGLILQSPNAEFQLVVATDGKLGLSKNGPGVRGYELVLWRRSETAAFCQALGLHKPVFLDFPDQGLRAEALAAQLLVLGAPSPFDRVFSPHPIELHPDHKAAAQACLNVFGGYLGYVTDGVLQDRLGEERAPDLEVELTPKQWQRKQELAECYRSQRHFLTERLQAVERFWQVGRRR